MSTQTIKTATDYETALARIMELMDAEAGSSEGDELDVLGASVEAYGTKHFPITNPNPAEVIRFRMEQYGLKDKDQRC